jgi:hypothetical protein
MTHNIAQHSRSLPHSALHSALHSVLHSALRYTARCTARRSYQSCSVGCLVGVLGGQLLGEIKIYWFLRIIALSRQGAQLKLSSETYTCYAWAGGTFFQLCCCVSFLVVAEIVLGDTYLPYQLCRCVFFLLWLEIVFGCTGWFFSCGGKMF